MSLTTRESERVIILDGLVETMGDLIELRAQARRACLFRCVQSLPPQINALKAEVHTLVSEARVVA
jgi:hypothetical protein